MIPSPSRKQSRSAAATVEFAVVAPFLFVLIFGAVEAGRGMMVMDLLSHAARIGARTATLAGKTTSDIEGDVNLALSNAGITGASTTVTVNDTEVDASTALEGDAVAVNVSVPISSVTWLPYNWFLGNVTLTETVVMRRE